MARPSRRRESRFPQSRKVVPEEVRAILGRREFKRSLRGTTDADNRRLHAEAQAQWEGEIAAARAKLRGEVVALNARQIDGVCGEWYREMLDSYEDEPGDETGWEAWADQLLDPLTRYEHDEEPPRFDPSKADLAEAEMLLRSKGIAADAHSIRRTAKRLLDIKLEFIGLMERRSAGDWRPANRLESFPKLEPIKPVEGVTSEPRGSDGALPFIQLLDAWAAERQPAPSTKKSYAITLRHLVRVLGFDDARRVTVEHVRIYKTAQLDAGLNVGTVADQVLAAGAMFKWAERNGLVTSNPFAGMAPRPTTRSSGEGKGYTDAEAAQLLLAARKETGWLRWLPWLLCFTGARISELAELRQKDIRQEAGVWIFDIVPTAVRAGKTTSFQRMLPIHPAVMAEGFLAHVASLPAAGPLLLDLRPDRHGSRVPTATTNFGRWVRRSGGLEGGKKQPTHAFRHRMEDQLRRARVLPEVFDAITGRHNPRNAGAGYGAGFRRMPDETAKELAKVPSPLGLVGSA